MRIGVDIDGVLADFNTAFHKRILDVLKDDRFPKEYNPTQPPDWEWPRYFRYSYEEEQKVWEGVWSDGSFWQRLNALPDVEWDIEHLDRLTRNGHDVYFITNRKGYQAKLQTDRWLEAHGMYYPTTLLTGDKLPVIKSLKLDCYIDDRLTTMNDAARRVDLNTRLYLRDSSHNKESREPNLRVVQSVDEMLRMEGL